MISYTVKIAHCIFFQYSAYFFNPSRNKQSLKQIHNEATFEILVFFKVSCEIHVGSHRKRQVTRRVLHHVALYLYPTAAKHTLQCKIYGDAVKSHYQPACEFHYCRYTFTYPGTHVNLRLPSKRGAFLWSPVVPQSAYRTFMSPPGHKPSSVVRNMRARANRRRRIECM